MMNPDMALAVVMNPKTGEVLGMSSRPTLILIIIKIIVVKYLVETYLSGLVMNQDQLKNNNYSS